MNAIPPGALARGLLRRAETATLATVMQPGRSGESGDLAGWPHAALVLVAAAPDGTPLLLLSDLAQHTTNAAVDARVALAVAGASPAARGRDAPAAGDGAEPLAGPRASLLGRLERVAAGAGTDAAGQDAAATLRARFLARHPSAQDYAGFGDFNLWRLRVEAVHLVAGFGRIAWAPGGGYAFDGSTDALAAAEADIVAHMNSDHADALALYATNLCGAAPGGWRMTGCDPEGIDMRTADGRQARLDFDGPVADAGEARAALVDLVRRARAAGGPAPGS